MESTPPEVEVIGSQTVGAITIEHLRYAGDAGAHVPAYLFRPGEQSARREPVVPAPALLVQHGANTSKEDFYIQAPARRWAAEGWTILAIDLAEHGERATSPPSPDPMVRRRLIGDPAFVERSVGDLMRGVNLLAADERVDANRIGFVGFSLGGMLGTIFTAREPRVRAAAIVIAGSFAHTRYWERGATPEERERRRIRAERTDPAFFAARIAPRPFLMVNTEQDPVFPREAALTLFAAAGQPKEHRWHPGTHHQWGGEVYRDVWEFLRAHLV